jgi:hypothetical protein
LAHLPSDALQELEDPDSLYKMLVGHKADIPDMAKVSFYVNPIVDVPGTPKK